MRMTSADIASLSFSATKLRAGYAADEVDAFLDRAAAALTEAQPGPGSLTSAEVESVHFSAIRFGSGYDMDEVDGALDRISAELVARGR